MPAPKTTRGRTTPKKVAPTRKPYDLDAAIREGKAEHDLEPFEFTFNGDTFSLPADFDLSALDLLDAGNLAGAFLRLLGNEQRARLDALPASFGIVALAKVMDAYMVHLGIDVGELSASTASSVSTAKP